MNILKVLWVILINYINVSKPIISVIIPCYNGEDSINKTIKSVINQSIGFENLEIIIIDDCSNDNTKAIITEYSKNYENIIGIFLDKNNGSPGIPRNIGIENAKGEYLMFLDSDDVFRNDICKHLYDVAILEDVDCVGCRYSINNKINKNFLDNYGDEIKLNSIDEFPEVMYTPANLTIWNKIYKKSFIKSNNIKFIKTWNEDLYFSINVFLKADGLVLLNNYIGIDYFLDLSKIRSSSPSMSQVMGSLYGLNKSLDVILKENPDYINALCEPLVHWILFFSKSDMTKYEKEIIYHKSKNLFNIYNFRTRLVNINLAKNIFINIFVKLFSSNFEIANVFLNAMNLFR